MWRISFQLFFSWFFPFLLRSQPFLWKKEEGGEKLCSEEEEEEGKEGGKNIGEREKGERKGGKQKGRKSDIVQRAQGGEGGISFSLSLCDLFLTNNSNKFH